MRNGSIESDSISLSASGGLFDGTASGLHVLARAFNGIAAGYAERNGRDRDKCSNHLQHVVLLVLSRYSVTRILRSQERRRTSTKRPATAAAAAIAGLTRCVRPPAPWRPSKLRFDVDAQRSPGASTSGFMPRHIEQPARRHSKPADSKTSRSPSSSAWRFTCAEPGTTIA